MVSHYNYSNNHIMLNVFEIDGEYILNIRIRGRKATNINFGDDLDSAKEEFYAIVEEQNAMIEEFIRQYE